MNTISINTRLYNDALNFASKKRMSISTLVELAVRHFIDVGQLQSSQSGHAKIDQMEFQKALDHMDSLMSGYDGMVVPADEDGRDARVEKYL